MALVDILKDNHIFLF